jgi:hypothetical protein
MFRQPKRGIKVKDKDYCNKAHKYRSEGIIHKNNPHPYYNRFFKLTRACFQLYYDRFQQYSSVLRVEVSSALQKGAASYDSPKIFLRKNG